jgi:predicted ribosome quality control (RQC) complex YloA/Tae2 family protein
MDIELDTNKSIWKNLQEIYDKIKSLKQKRERIEQEIKKTKQEIEKIKTNSSNLVDVNKQDKQEETKTGKKRKEKKKWYEQYHWFYTTNNFLVVSGKNAKQNDELFKLMKDEDLFFHADIFGAPATILKNGFSAKEQDLLEAACWAASFSSAWKKKSTTIDVYYVKKEQLTKYSQGQYVGRGAFVILGKREWFKNTTLGLKIIKNLKDEKLRFEILPINHTKNNEIILKIYPGDIEKEEFLKKVQEKFFISKKELEGRLPSGGFFYESKN